MKGSCRFCLYFDQVEKDGGGIGRCRYNAPPRWPDVKESDWCGRFRATEHGISRGRYRASIVQSEITPIDRRNPVIGQCLRLTWRIESGQYVGTEIVQRLDMWATQPQHARTIQYANQQFAAIRQATGKMALQDSSELHHIPCTIVVEHPAYDGASNSITHVECVALAADGERP